MPRSVPASLLAHQHSGASTLAWGLKVTRADLSVYGFTSHDVDATISSVLYASGPGLDVTSIVSQAGFQVDNCEITILADGVIFTRDDILAGRWDGATFELFQYNWADVSQGRDVLKVGWFGAITMSGLAFVAELRGLKQKLQSSIVNVSQPTCRNRLGDSRCGVNLAAGGRTVTGQVTHVTSQSVVREDRKSVV